jgi:membrane protein implicated in regulation of membrane protease activity
VNAKRTVALLLVALALYFALIGYRGVYLIGQPGLALKVLGAAVLVLPLIGIWVVVAEVRFGLATERLARRLDGPEDEPLPRSVAGRVDRTAADARFDRRRAEVEADPDDWRRWYRLALAYDDSGDRRRARAAMRTAIERAT